MHSFLTCVMACTYAASTYEKTSSANDKHSGKNTNENSKSFCNNASSSTSFFNMKLHYVLLFNIFIFRNILCLRLNKGSKFASCTFGNHLTAFLHLHVTERSWAKQLTCCSSHVRIKTCKQRMSSHT